MSSTMHLMQMPIHSASTDTLLSWADPKDGQLDGLQDFACWQNLARTLERGRFDGVFFADSPATHPLYQNSVDDFVDQVVPVLQRRGLFRTEYEGDSFRANLRA